MTNLGYNKASGYQVLAAIICQFFGKPFSETPIGDPTTMEHDDKDKFKFLYDLWISCRQSEELRKNSTTVPPAIIVFSCQEEPTNLDYERIHWAETFILMRFHDFATNPETAKEARKLLWMKEPSEVGITLETIINDGSKYVYAIQRSQKLHEFLSVKLKELVAEEEIHKPLPETPEQLPEPTPEFPEPTMEVKLPEPLPEPEPLPDAEVEKEEKSQGEEQ